MVLMEQCNAVLAHNNSKNEGLPQINVAVTTNMAPTPAVPTKKSPKKRITKKMREAQAFELQKQQQQGQLSQQIQVHASSQQQKTSPSSPQQQVEVTSSIPLPAEGAAPVKNKASRKPRKPRVKASDSTAMADNILIAASSSLPLQDDQANLEILSGKVNITPCFVSL
jgi:cell division protein FtsN